MEKIFIDTSALYALVSTEDKYCQTAVSAWEELVKGHKSLVTNNYVIVECFTLVQSRLGLNFARQLHQNIIPFLEIEWVDEDHHLNSIDRVLAANRRQLSLVDCSSFETMHRLKIETVFTFDEHYREQGFTVIP